MTTQPPPQHLKNPNHNSTISNYLKNCVNIPDPPDPSTDVTLHVSGSTFKTHRIVLSHYSNFFLTLFNNLNDLPHFDIFLEGFDIFDINAILQFMYTGSIGLSGGGWDDEQQRIIEVASMLQIPTIQNLINSQPQKNNNNPMTTREHLPDNPTHPPEETDDDDEYDEDMDDEDRATTTNAILIDDGCEQVPVSKRRKQARPQRHTTPPSPQQQPEQHDDEDHEEESYSPNSCEDAESPTNTQQQSPDPMETIPQQPNLQPPPPHYLFLRNIMNNDQGFFPPHPHPHPHDKRLLLQQQQKNYWGKLIVGSKGGVEQQRGGSRAQHSAPRGGPPRAWSNQDLTEALHNVWNKKMTTSQASRIFGIPYNSLLMYVRGKYGKSLKLDLLKKGLDLALLEKQKKSMSSKPNNNPASCSRLTTAQPPSPPQQMSSNSIIQQSKSINNNFNDSNVVEWMMMNSNGGKTCVPHPPFHHHRNNELFFGGLLRDGSGRGNGGK